MEGDKKDDMKTEHGLDDENGCSPSDRFVALGNTVRCDRIAYDRTY